jgi:hypothetical protein
LSAHESSQPVRAQARKIAAVGLYLPLVADRWFSLSTHPA